MVEARLATFAADSKKAQARLAELEAQSSALQGEVSDQDVLRGVQIL
jgi:hypothetical protein